MKHAVRQLPVLGTALRAVEGWWRRRRFPGSRRYWERRYRSGADSGAGSYGPMAAFKAEVLNGFVREHSVRTVVEFGCGDGAQLGLADYPNYVGLDVSQRAVDLCAQRFATDPSKRFFLYTEDYPADLRPHVPRADLALSLDVVYHLVEDAAYERHLRDVFDAAERFVAIYSSDLDRIEPAAPHVRHRRFTDWVTGQRPRWRLLRRVPNRFPYREADGSGSLADFFFFERTEGE
jgi:SAM-dependent methyltransferase